MDWLRENWFWLAVVVLFFWMHGKMHGKMHGGHGGHGGQRSHGGCGDGSHDHEEPPRPDASGRDVGKEHQHAQH